VGKDDLEDEVKKPAKKAKNAKKKEDARVANRLSSIRIGDHAQLICDHYVHTTLIQSINFCEINGVISLELSVRIRL